LFRYKLLTSSVIVLTLAYYLA